MGVFFKINILGKGSNLYLIRPNHHLLPRSLVNKMNNSDSHRTINNPETAQADADTLAYLLKQHNEKVINRDSSSLESAQNHTCTLDAFSPAEIDSNATFKYALIKIQDINSLTSKYLVRGNINAKFHADAAKNTVNQILASSNITGEILGGGRIQHDLDNKTIRIFGFSYGFGKPDHTISANACKEIYPTHHIEVSDEGYFKVTTFGESHGKSVGCVIDNAPPRLELCEEDVNKQLRRRRPGQSAITTPRNEKDAVHIMSGVEDNLTLGVPIMMMVMNEDQRPHDYSDMSNQVYRPSHADYTYNEKYTIHSKSGGGRSSARETIGRVCGGVVAEKWVTNYVKSTNQLDFSIVAFTSSIGRIQLNITESLLDTVTRNDVDAHITRCPDTSTQLEMEKEITTALKDRDSIGGTVTCVIRNCPIGLGEPCFDKLSSKLAHAMFSIPAVKGFEIGSGFSCTKMRGSLHNDVFDTVVNLPSGKKQFTTKTNYSGGIQGGLSNGMPIYFSVAFKPASTIGLAQTTMDTLGNMVELEAKGRHDPSVVPRAVPIVESMAALVIADLLMAQLARQSATSANTPIHNIQ